MFQRHNHPHHAGEKGFQIRPLLRRLLGLAIQDQSFALEIGDRLFLFLLGFSFWFFFLLFSEPTLGHQASDAIPKGL